MLSKTGKLISNYAGFPVSRIFLEIMTEKPLPVSFAGIMNRMPMPVHHAVCARCQVAVRLQINIWLHSIRKSTPLKIKIMCNKLILSFVFIHNICLPAKEPVNQGSLEFFKFCAKASIDRTTYIREIFPGIDPIAPIVKAEFII